MTGKDLIKKAAGVSTQSSVSVGVGADVRVRVSARLGSEDAERAARVFRQWLPDKDSSNVIMTGSMGYYDLEPLCIVEKPGTPAIIYKNVTEDIAAGICGKWLGGSDPMPEAALCVLPSDAYAADDATDNAAKYAAGDTVEYDAHNKSKRAADDTAAYGTGGAAVYGADDAARLPGTDLIPQRDSLPLFRLQNKVATRRCGFVDPMSISSSIVGFEGYAGLIQAMGMTPDAVLEKFDTGAMIECAGPGVPVFPEWKRFQSIRGAEKTIVCSGFDNDIETRAALLLLEGDPHGVLEGLLMTAYALGVSRAVIAIPAGIGRIRLVIENALDEMREYGLIGANILESGFNCDISIQEVPRALVACEKTALLNCLEGRQAIPSIRGGTADALFGAPALVTGIETLARAPVIFRYAIKSPSENKTGSVSDSSKNNSKIVTLTGGVSHAYTVELPVGSSVGDAVLAVGGAESIKAVQLGGPTSAFFGADAAEKPIDFAAAREAGAEFGLAVINIVSDSGRAIETIARSMDSLRDESCGKCVFCREGILHLHRMLNDIADGKSEDGNIRLIAELGLHMRENCLCPLGQTAANPVLSGLELFLSDYEHHFKRGERSFGGDNAASSFAETEIAYNDTGSGTDTDTDCDSERTTPPRLISVTVNGRGIETEAGKNLLDVCLDSGVYIPHLCHHNELHPVGACRLCVVEIDGMESLQTSCAVAAKNGMSIRTDSDAIRETRLLAIELMLSGHQLDCGVCVKYLNCELQSLKQYLLEDELRLIHRSRLFGTTETNPLFIHEPNKCVLCGRCIRACRDLRGVGVLYYKRQNGETYIGVGPDPENDLSLAGAGCRFCGACAEVCPSGAIMDKDEFGQNKSRKEALLPCVNACPAEIDIPGFIRLIKTNDMAAATALIREKVPFPLVLGYVCGHPCESSCRRGMVSHPMSICHLKRYAAENDPERLRVSDVHIKPATGKRIAVIGAGPAGLSAAFYLTLQGHSVAVYEKMPAPGGMLRYGIPEYRLPADILNQEIRDIEEIGINIQTNKKIESIDDLIVGGLDGGYDAVLIAVGADEGVCLRIPGAKGEGVQTSVEFLKSARLDEIGRLDGRVVMVLGGGDVAFDCARTSIRLGAGEVMLACLESKDAMPASPGEVAAGEEEGVKIYPSRSFNRILREDGRVTGVQFLEVSSLYFDNENNPHVETDDDSMHEIAADLVIFAVGQRPGIPEGFGAAKTDKGYIDTNQSTMATDREDVFAVSDAVTGTKNVISAIGAGRKAAAAIDKYLGGRGRFETKLVPAAEPEKWLGKADGFAEQTRVPEKLLPKDERIGSFCVAELSLSEDEALYEASRCLQCDMRLKMKPEKFWSSY